MTISPATSILVADDEQGIRDLLRFTLEPLGYEVVTVCDGVEAVDTVRRRAFDLVILDVHMPHMAGPDAFANIREIRPSQKVLVFSSTSDSTRAFERRVMERGACGCLFKPVDLDELIGSIERALREGAGREAA